MTSFPSAFLTENKSFCTVDNDEGYKMAYVEMGPATQNEEEYTMIFLHGNPTSSFLWRNIMPNFANRFRTIAPDLIGMGDSNKLRNTTDGSYTFTVHSKFLATFIDNCVIGQNSNGDGGVAPPPRTDHQQQKKNIILVLHDWGSALGFHWAKRHPNLIKGIAYFEGFVKSLESNQLDPSIADFFAFMKSDDGEVAVLQQNIFVEQTLPSSILRNLTQDEMDVYRSPYLTVGESRRPTIDWPREVPIDGSPIETHNIINDYGTWFAHADHIPKLLIVGEPGVILTGDTLEFARTWPNQTEISVPGLHFLQEDSPQEIATAIDDWMQDSVLRTTTSESIIIDSSSSDDDVANSSSSASLPVGGGAAMNLILAFFVLYRCLKVA